MRDFFYGYKKWGVIYGRSQEEIHGRSAHGSAPDQGKDAIVAAAAVVMGLQTLSSRVNDLQNTFVLTVGMMNGGTQSNIIADEVELVGTTRAFDKAFRKSLPRVGKVASEASRIGYWRYEKERRRSSQVGDIDERGSVSSTPLTKAPYPPLRGLPSLMGKAKRRRLRHKKGSQPRLAALGSPFQGKGLAWTLPPSYGRRCPEGAEVGWREAV